MKRFKVFTDMNKDPRNYCVVDIPHGTIIASGLSWVSATFICDALNEKFCREREAENVQADS